MAAKEEEKDEKEKKKPKTSNALAAAMRAAEQKNGQAGEYVSEKVEEAVIGIPLPGLSLMYLFDSNVCPISKVIKIAGRTMSNKSSLGFEFMRWIMQYAGFAHYVENEGAKWSPSLVKSIVGPQNMSKFAVDIAENGSHAMRCITNSVSWIQDEREKAAKDKKKVDHLVGIMLDSLVGSDTEASTEKMMKDGAASRQFPETALLWTNYFKTLSSQLVGLPIIFVFINHLKEMADQRTGIMKKHTPGGVAQDFHSAYAFHVNRVADGQKVYREIDGKDVLLPHEFRTLAMQCYKSSLGTEGRKIKVDFVWYFDEQNNQISFFDWDASTAYLLLEEQGMYGNVQGGGYKKLQEVCDVSMTKNAYSSDRLKLKGVAANTLGRAVHADPVLMQELMWFLHVKNHPYWTGAMPPPPPPQPKVEEPEPDSNKKTKKQKKESEVSGDFT